MRKNTIISICVFILGMIVGGYLFHASIPRSFLSLDACHKFCLTRKDIFGLVASVGIQNFSGMLPGVIQETDKTIVLTHPFPEGKTHYLIIPKKDIQDIASVSDEDQGYINDAFSVIGQLVREHNFKKYKVVTFGEGYQDVRYLHFHLISND